MIVSKSDFIYDDQDILNAECQGRVHYLPAEWNVMHDCAGRVAKVFTWAPNEVFDAYNASRTMTQRSSTMPASRSRG
jgi:lipopolysaccharide biosynthesis glycosyltransferase